MGFVLLAFLLYHLHLALKNTTTNETFKWQIARVRVQRQRERALRAREITGASVDLWTDGKGGPRPRVDAVVLRMK